MLMLGIAFAAGLVVAAVLIAVIVRFGEKKVAEQIGLNMRLSVLNHAVKIEVGCRDDDEAKRLFDDLSDRAKSADGFLLNVSSLDKRMFHIAPVTVRPEQLLN